jgi:putative membrane protein
MMYFNEYSWPFMSFGWVFMVIFWVLIIAWVIYLIKLSDNNDKTNKTNWDKTLNILKERYAKWEIDKKQFDEMKSDLK